jgi:hypothetical protein
MFSMSVACFFWCITPMLYTLSGALRSDTALTFRNVINRAATHDIDTLVQHRAFESTVHEATFRQITLLTSLFLRDEATSAHYDELMGALTVNMHNPHISNIHVLMEAQSFGDSGCEELHTVLKQASKSGSCKVVCAPVRKQPTYYDFFTYANTTLRNTHVLLANTDIVFDASLSLINLTTLATGTMGYVFSVMPPPYGGEYHKLFGNECHASPRCTTGMFDGWNGVGGTSWDAYLFHSPLPAMDSSHLDHFMNTIGGENRAGYQLEVTAGVELFNPCKHVHAFHWHCIGGKMHHTEVRVDSDDKNVGNIVPCWDCPGVGYSVGHSPSASLCQQGILQAVKLDKLKNAFRKPFKVQACLQNGTEESMLLDRWGQIDTKEIMLLEMWGQEPSSLNICKFPIDSNCFVVSYGALNEHHYYR